MNRIKSLYLPAILTVLFIAGVAQTKYADRGVNIFIKGSSTLHDWEMASKEGKCDATFVFNGEKLTGISNLNFNVVAETLKSGTGGLDKNGYKALETKKYPTITFVMSSGSIAAIDATTYQFKGQGNLTIAGNTKLTDLSATLKYNAADKSFTCSGTKAIKMSDWKIEPPSFMFGTIKTADQITIGYNLKITK